MLNEIRKIPAFIKRDFKILLSYKLAFLTSLLSIVFTLFYFVLFGSMFGAAQLSILSKYGGNFIYYILVGSVGWSFMWSVMASASSSISTEMMMGTLESILVTSTRMTTIVISYAIFGGIFGLVSIVILLLIGYVIFGISAFSTATIYTWIIFILTTLMMVGFGMMFGGLTIWLKNIGDSIPFLQDITMFFCGVYFPPEVLPHPLEYVSYLIPFYYSMEGLRKSLIPSTEFAEIIFYIIILLVLSISSLYVGVVTLNKGLEKAKKEGTLAFY